MRAEERIYPSPTRHMLRKTKVAEITQLPANGGRQEQRAAAQGQSGRGKPEGQHFSPRHVGLALPNSGMYRHQTFSTWVLIRMLPWNSTYMNTKRR